ncbi:hypothetical protein PI125_g18373 [Phytophthora idaei]|nr:hypothetical protein PI125_g18373 [Phytophthora idaei]KAG3137148.1 hypothetical protein PI126_g17513 [Phytophthora idaei]
MSDVDEAPKSKPAEDAQVDSDAVDYGESDDEDLKPPSGSDDEDSDDSSDSSVKRKNLPTIRPINHRKLQKERPRGAKEKPQTLSPRERRRQEDKAMAFLMKTWTTRTFGWSRTSKRRTTSSSTSARRMKVHPSTATPTLSSTT